ncbi:hypothetical protein [Amycolatopsis coloradensis]|nr:hypothetical protein [Amycolatopsis coloradensis]
MKPDDSFGTELFPYSRSFTLTGEKPMTLLIRGDRETFHLGDRET